MGPSPLRTARYSRLPTPGTLKMPSVTIAPPISVPRSAPRKVTTGISELRRMCTRTTRPAGQALGRSGAHVVGVHVLDDGGAGQAQDVGEGRQAKHDRRQDELPHGLAPELTVGLAQPSWTPTANCSRKPSTKIGMPMTISDATSTVASKNLPLRMPAMRPKTMPKTPSKINAMTASRAVTGKHFAQHGGGWACPEKSWPRSKVKMLFR